MGKIKKALRAVYGKYMKIPVAARAGLWFVACTMLQKCIGFITVPIFTRIMPPVEYGLYSTYLSWYSILTVFCTLNMHSVIYVNNYTKADTQKEKDEAAVPLLSLSTVVTIILFVLYLIFHGWLEQYISMPFVLVCLLFAHILFEPPVLFWTMQQRFEYKYVKLVVRTIAMVVLNTVLGIVFVLIASGNEAVARFLSIVLVQAIFGGVFYVYFWKRAKKVFSTKGWLHALKVQLPLLPHSLSLTVLSSSDRIMITDMVGKAQAGIYSVAYSAGFIVNMLKNSIVDALKPWIYQKIKAKDFASIRKTCNIVMVLVTLISVVVTAFGPEIIFIMAPEQYHEAIYVIPPVAASSFFTFMYNLFSIVGLYFEKSNKIMIASVSGALLNLGLNYVCIQWFGYIAAAYTTLFCYMFFSFAHYLIMRGVCKKQLDNVKVYDIRFILLMSAVVVAFSIIFTLTYHLIFVRYGIILAVLVIMIIKRKTFISTFKDIKNSKSKKTEIQKESKSE